MGYKSVQQKPYFRNFEKATIFIFLALVFALGVASQIRSGSESFITEDDPDVAAYAHAMPGRGWVPLTVYFSAFGSNSTLGQIVKYEWDLDGNGYFDTVITTSEGYSQYTYSKPGVYKIHLRITDSEGRQATDSVEVEILHPTDSSVNYWQVFDDSKVRKVTFELTQENWDRMWEDIESKVTVPADVVLFGKRITNVGLRMRGQFSLREAGQKKPWKIDTDYFVEGQEYQNLKQLLFINNFGDTTLVREKLAYEMMAFAGLPASFTCYTQIWVEITDDSLPPEFWGVYTMIERVDRKFIANRFGQDAKSGNLYKASHAQRGPMDLVYYGDSIADFPMQNGQVAYGKMTNEAEADYADIIQLTRVIDGVQYATPEEFALALEAVFDVDQFLRYMAVVDATMNWDIYPYTGNNYYLFNNPITGKFEWIPWDLTWGDNPQHPLFETSEPGLVDRTPLHTRVFQVPEYRLRYAAYLDLLIRHLFNAEIIGSRAKDLQTMIAPLLNQGSGDKMYLNPQEINQNEFKNSWRDLASLVERRSKYLQSMLADYQQVPTWGSPIIRNREISEPPP